MRFRWIRVKLWYVYATICTWRDRKLHGASIDRVICYRCVEPVMEASMHVYIDPRSKYTLRVRTITTVQFHTRIQVGIDTFLKKEKVLPWY